MKLAVFFCSETNHASPFSRNWIVNILQQFLGPILSFLFVCKDISCIVSCIVNLLEQTITEAFLCLFGCGFSCVVYKFAFNLLKIIIINFQTSGTAIALTLVTFPSTKYIVKDKLGFTLKTLKLLNLVYLLHVDTLMAWSTLWRFWFVFHFWKIWFSSDVLIGWWFIVP